MKEPNAKIELFQKGMEDKITSLIEQIENLRNEGAENQKNTMASLIKVQEYVN